MTAPVRAALYLRVSTGRQAENDLSIPDQRRQAKGYCTSRGWEIVADYVEPGVSATDDRRPEFQRMIDAATTKPPAFDTIIVHSFSRFFRDPFQLEFYVSRLANSGVRLVSITQELGDDPMSNMIRQIMALFDEYQSKENAKHTLRAMKENARQGFRNGSLPPIGYRIVEAAEQHGHHTKKTLEVDPIQAETVRMIFRLAREGDGTSGPMGVKKITKNLNAAGIRRTADGSVKRQAARFRVYAHFKDGSFAEITADDARFEWGVAVANLKAGWYDFNQAMDLPDGQSQPALRRNRDISIPGGRTSLDIVPIPLSIEGPDAQPVAFNDGTFWRKIVPLGELRTGAKGRLLFLGGHGVAAPFRKGLVPLTFANNVGWHDDISDGPVRAVVTFPGRPPIEAEPGYVAVTPPNYAPGVAGLVTMDDVVRETFQNQGWIAKPTATSFTNDIWPIFDRLTGLQWINHGLFLLHGHGSPIDARDLAVIDQMRDGAAANASWRQAVFALFRDPNAGGDLVEPKIPRVYGDGVDTLWDPPRKLAHTTGLLAVTPTQYDHLRRWAAGDFSGDWPGSIPISPDFSSLSPGDQVAHLERAALRDCFGGPFHPGIEITWVMRLPRLWLAAYRLKVLPGEGPARQDYGAELTPAICVGPGGPFDGIAAGALTRFMGVPWQTDGTSCNSSADYFPSTFLSMPTFWGARVPDQVLAAASYERAARLDPSKLPVQGQKHFMLRVDWLRDVRGPDYYARLQKMVTDWAGLGMVLPVQNPPAHLPADTRVEQGRDPDFAGSDLKIKLVTAVEELNEPASTRVKVFAALEAAVAESRVPPKRSFRQGEI